MKKLLLPLGAILTATIPMFVIVASSCTNSQGTIKEGGELLSTKKLEELKVVKPSDVIGQLSAEELLGINSDLDMRLADVWNWDPTKLILTLIDKTNELNIETTIYTIKPKEDI